MVFHIKRGKLNCSELANLRGWIPVLYKQAILFLLLARCCSVQARRRRGSSSRKFVLIWQDQAHLCLLSTNKSPLKGFRGTEVGLGGKPASFPSFARVRLHRLIHTLSDTLGGCRRDWELPRRSAVKKTSLFCRTTAVTGVAPVRRRRSISRVRIVARGRSFSFSHICLVELLGKIYFSAPIRGKLVDLGAASGVRPLIELRMPRNCFCWLSCHRDIEEFRCEPIRLG